MPTPSRDSLMICIDLNPYNLFQSCAEKKQISDLFRKNKKQNLIISCGNEHEKMKSTMLPIIFLDKVVWHGRFCWPFLAKANWLMKIFILSSWRVMILYSLSYCPSRYVGRLFQRAETETFLTKSWTNSISCSWRLIFTLHYWLGFFFAWSFRSSVLAF